MHPNDIAESILNRGGKFSEIRGKLANLIGHSSDQGISWIEKWIIVGVIEDFIDEKIKDAEMQKSPDDHNGPPGIG